MTHPYIPPQPGGPGAYEQQLTARAHRAEQDRATLETELGQARRRNAELQQRAEQADDRISAVRVIHTTEIANEYGGLECSTCREVWPCPTASALGCPPVCADGHTYDGYCLVPADLPGVITYTNWPGEQGWAFSCGATDGCDGLVSYGHGSAAAARRAYDRHLKRDHAAANGCTNACSEGHTYEPPCEQAAGQIVILPPQPVRPGPMLFQPCSASDQAQPPTLTARYLSYPRPACTGCEWAAHPPLTCDEAAAFRDRFDNLLTEKLKEIRTDDSNLIGYRDAVNAPLRFETITALADKLKQDDVPRRKVQRSAPSSTGLTVVTTDPIEEIAAEPATLERLKSQFFTAPATRLGAQVGEINAFFGFPLIPDLQLPPGEVHMRPARRADEARP